MNLEEMKKQMVHWMEEMKHGYRASDMYMTVVNGRIRILMFTLTNSYSIVARPASEENDRDYLGAQVSSRTPRAGEDWTRGNDLADGDFSKKTWEKILGDIVGYELVKIQRPVEELYKSSQSPIRQN